MEKKDIPNEERRLLIVNRVRDIKVYVQRYCLKGMSPKHREARPY